MAKIFNPDVTKLTLPSGHVVPARGELVCDNQMILMSDSARMLNTAFLAGQLTYELDPEPVEEDTPPIADVSPAPETLMLTNEGA